MPTHLEPAPAGEVSETGLDLLQLLISERIGLAFKPEKRGLLVRKLTPLARAQGLTSFSALYRLLREAPTDDPLWQQVVEALVVRESRFWREMGPILALTQEVIPALLRQNRRRPVRIWSAGCACGEEPYSVAIALQEASLLRARWVEIVGTDISTSCLQAAQEARFSKRALPSDLRARYFVEEAGGKTYRLRDDLARWVTFRRLNLLDREGVLRMAPVDVVLCRNVFIYFSPDAIASTLEAFHAALETPGYLVVAAAESLARRYGRFQMVQVADAYLYQKEPERKEARGGTRP